MASCSLEQARGTRLASASHGGLARAGLGRCCCQGLRRGRGVLDAQAISPMAKKSVSQEMMEECRPHDPDYKGFLLLNPLCVAVLVHTSLHSVCGCVVFNGITAPPCFVTRMSVRVRVTVLPAPCVTVWILTLQQCNF